MASLRIAEIFESLQGEGIWTGTPSVFVRVSGCNLRCIWCDTPYASWQPEGPVLSVENVLAEVLAAAGPQTTHIVITGGEPMIFPAVIELATSFSERGMKITIETAGTRFLDLPCDLMSISPKLAHSTPDGAASERHERERLNFSVLRELVSHYHHQLKFVVRTDHIEADCAEIEAILEEVPNCQNISLMPEGTNSMELQTAAQVLAPVCLQRGWLLSDRLHIHLYGNTRGT